MRTLVICHTRELAYQIKHEFERFAKYFPVRGEEGNGRGGRGGLSTVVLPISLWSILQKWIYNSFFRLSNYCLLDSDWWMVGFAGCHLLISLNPTSAPLVGHSLGKRSWCAVRNRDRRLSPRWSMVELRCPKTKKCWRMLEMPWSAWVDRWIPQFIHFSKIEDIQDIQLPFLQPKFYVFFWKSFWEDRWVNPGLLSPHFDRHARPRAGLGAREGADGAIGWAIGTYGDVMGVMGVMVN